MEPLRTNRGLLKLILLSLVTLGIYPLFFWSKYAKDMNTVCEGDGRKTRGILFRLLISAITFGIYDYIWMYGVGERIFQRSARRNIPTTTTGGKVLAWFILGSLIIVGPFIALHKLLDGLNQLCIDYNEIHGLSYANAGAVSQTIPQPGVQNAPVRVSAPEVNAGVQGSDSYQMPVQQASFRQPPQMAAEQASFHQPPQMAAGQAPARSAATGAQEASDRIHGYVNNAGKAVQSAEQFARKTAKDLNLEVEDQAGMKWLPILPVLSAVCFLLSFIFGLSMQPSLFSVFAALGLALVCFLKTEKIKPLAAVPFSVLVIQLLQSVLWRVPYIGYFRVFQWITLVVSLLMTVGAVIHWLLLFGNPSSRKSIEMIVPGSIALMAVFYIVSLFIPSYERLDFINQGRGVGGFSVIVGTIGYALFAVSYLLLFYRSEFKLLTAVKSDAPAAPVWKPAAEPFSKPAAVPVRNQINVPAEPTLPFEENPEAAVPAASPWPASIETEPQQQPFGIDPRYQQEAQVPRIEMQPRVEYSSQRNVFDYSSAPAAPAPQVDADMAACPACGYLSPAGTAQCPNCGAPMRVRRRRSASYGA